MAAKKPVSGYGLGSVDTVMSVDAVEKAARELSGGGPSRADLMALVEGETALDISALCAGYGRMEILHGLDLIVGKGQSLCLIGPNGAGKSTVLHAVFGFADIMSGTMHAAGKDISRLSSNQKLASAGVAYILQDNSVFPDMTVEENLLMGGFLKNRPREARQAAERIFDRYARLA